MKYIRTKENQFREVKEKSCVKEFNKKLYYFNDSRFAYRFENGEEIIKQSDDIFDLVSTGDLLICVYTITHQSFPVIYKEKVPFDFESKIYQLKEWFVRDRHDNFVRVAYRNEDDLYGKVKLVL